MIAEDKNNMYGRARGIPPIVLDGRGSLDGDPNQAVVKDEEVDGKELLGRLLADTGDVDVSYQVQMVDTSLALNVASIS